MLLATIHLSGTFVTIRRFSVSQMIVSESPKRFSEKVLAVVATRFPSCENATPSISVILPRSGGWRNVEMSSPFAVFHSLASAFEAVAKIVPSGEGNDAEVRKPVCGLSSAPH